MSNTSSFETQVLEAAKLLPSDEQGLLAVLGLRALIVEKRPALASQLSPEISPHELPRPPLAELVKIGRRILNACNSELYQFACSDHTSADRDQLVEAIVGRKETAVAVITQVLMSISVGPHQVPAGTAVVAATLIFRLLFVPAGKTLCEVWKEHLSD